MISDVVIRQIEADPQNLRAEMRRILPDLTDKTPDPCAPVPYVAVAATKTGAIYLTALLGVLGLVRR